jgi:ectoine hydroxylase-related dioxygenase (phytanoyl-CoA dioxygenase family)
MITVDLQPPFDRRELFANSWLFAVLSAVFEGDFVLDAYGVVCSLPAAPMQHIHQDGADIFPQAGLNRLLPIVAVTVAIPLLEMNEIHGTTAVWPGSHRDEACGPIEDASVKGDEPQLREGSCLLWDYRLRHGGTPNRGAAPRPLLYMTYCRPWFVDHKNYAKLARPDRKGRTLRTPLRAPKGFLAQTPEDLWPVLARVQEC